jgi:hypothetical protein
VYAPWQRLATEFGVMNVLARPVHSRFGGYSGVFVLYADAENYFNEVGTGLLSALAALFSSVLTDLVGASGDRAQCPARRADGLAQAPCPAPN